MYDNGVNGLYQNTSGSVTLLDSVLRAWSPSNRRQWRTTIGSPCPWPSAHRPFFELTIHHYYVRYKHWFHRKWPMCTLSKLGKLYRHWRSYVRYRFLKKFLVLCLSFVLSRCCHGHFLSIWVYIASLDTFGTPLRNKFPNMFLTSSKIYNLWDSCFWRDSLSMLMLITPCLRVTMHKVSVDTLKQFCYSSIFCLVH